MLLERPIELEKSIKEFKESEINTQQLFSVIMNIACNCHIIKNMTPLISSLLDFEFLKNQEKIILDKYLEFRKDGLLPDIKMLEKYGLISPIHKAKEIVAPDEVLTQSPQRLIEMFKWHRIHDTLTYEIMKFALEVNKTGKFTQEMVDFCIGMTKKLYPTEYPVVNNCNTVFNTSIEYLDKTGCNFKNGTINTIIAQNPVSSIYGIEITNNAIRNGKNVCYISTSCKKETCYMKFLANYLCEKGNDFNYAETDINKISPITKEEFENIFHKQLSIMDNETLSRNTPDNLSKQLENINEIFIENTNRPIDLIIVDTIENLRLEKGNKYVIQSNAIIDTYAHLFEKQSKNLMGTGISFCTIFLTELLPTEYHKTEFSLSNQYDTCSCSLGKLSDLIIAYQCEKLDKKMATQLYLLKSEKGLLLDEPIHIEFDLEGFSMLEGSKKCMEEEVGLSSVMQQENITENEEINRINDNVNNITTQNESDLNSFLEDTEEILPKDNEIVVQNKEVCAKEIYREHNFSEEKIELLKN